MAGAIFRFPPLTLSPLILYQLGKNKITLSSSSVGKGNVVMFTFCSFFGEISSKSWIPVTDILGCVEKGIAQISGTPLFHVRIAILELAGLVSGWRHAGIRR